MSNLNLAKEAFNQQKKTISLVKVVIEIAGSPETMRDLNAVGAEDLRSYFIPNALGLQKGDDVKVRFTYHSQ